MRRILTAAGLMLPAAIVVAAQTQAPAFDAASVKANTSSETRIRFETPPGRLTAVNVPLRFAIRQAYRTAESRIAGGPSWLDTDRFDIVATAPAGSTPDTSRLMLRTLLADRFGLVLHTESRDMTVYSLRVNRNDRSLGPHLRPSATDCAGRGASAVAGRVRCGILVSQGPASASLRGGSATLTEFVRFLGDFLDRPVVDDTGLTGTFDLELQFAAERSAFPGSAVPGGLTAAPNADEIPSVFTAVQEQLGLKLDVQRARTEIMVIDRVERPHEN